MKHDNLKTRGCLIDFACIAGACLAGIYGVYVLVTLPRSTNEPRVASTAGDSDESVDDESSFSWSGFSSDDGDDGKKKGKSGSRRGRKTGRRIASVVGFLGEFAAASEEADARIIAANFNNQLYKSIEREHEKSKSENEERSRLLIGTWNYSAVANGKSVSKVITFLHNGTLQFTSSIMEAGRAKQLQGQGTWRIDRQKLQVEIVDNQLAVSIGLPANQIEIVTLENEQFVVRISTSELQHYRRARM